jgi:hypothetical protein
VWAHAVRPHKIKGFRHRYEGFSHQVVESHPVFHFDIKDGKIWVQENNTDVELDKDLEEMGISKKEIVVGFHHPLMREHSDYATA